MRLIITSLMLCAAVAAQDLPCSAITIVSDGLYSGDTSTLTASNAVTQSCGSASANQDAWYTFTPAASGNFSADTCGPGTAYDTTLALFSGADCMTLTQEVCNDDFCGLQSGFSFSVVAGTTYYVRVSGFSSNTGPYDLTVATDPGVLGTLAAPVLSIDGSAFNLASCSTVTVPAGPGVLGLEMRTSLPLSGVIIGYAANCAPGSGNAGTTNTFDLEYATLNWVVDGSGNNLLGTSSFWNQFAFTDSTGRFVLAASADLRAGSLGAFQAAVMDPSQPFGVDLTQALAVDAL